MTSGVIGGVFVRAAPVYEPPYDDGSDDRHPGGGGAVPELPFDAGARPRELLWPRAVAAHEHAARQRAPKDRAPRARTAKARSVAAPVAARRYLDMCIEVLNGYRPAAQLRPLTEPHRFADVADQLVRRTSRVRIGDQPAGRAGRRQRLVRVRRMVTSEPVDGVAETAAVLHHGDVTWAMALRLELRHGEWICTFAGVV